MPELGDILPKITYEKMETLHENLKQLKSNQKLLATLPEDSLISLDRLIETAQFSLVKMSYNNLDLMRMTNESLYNLYRDVDNLLTPDVLNEHPQLQAFVDYPKMKELETKFNQVSQDPDFAEYSDLELSGIKTEASGFSTGSRSATPPDSEEEEDWDAEFSDDEPKVAASQKFQEELNLLKQAKAKKNDDEDDLDWDEEDKPSGP